MTSTILSVRRQFIALKKMFPLGNTDDGMLELIGTSFHATENSIFGEPNEAYVQAELDWYESQSRNVYDIRPEPPTIWKNVASHDGEVNSQYGWLLHSDENGAQYAHVLDKLREFPNTRQGVAIYTRPSMHTDWNRNGMHDFVCTNAVNYFLRGGAVHAVVQMRSNDVVFGYRNDWAWQRHVLQSLAEDLDAEPGTTTWQAASLHVYPRHFHLIPEA